MGNWSISAQLKVWVAVGLAVISLVLVLVGKVVEDQQTEAEVLQPLDLSIIQAHIDAEIDSLLVKHSVRVERSRKRTVPQTGIVGGASKRTLSDLSRVEREVVVSKSFSTVDFNRRLSNLGARYGMQVSARENRKLRTTSMDLRYRGTTIETILFVTRK
ncbi:MAG: hypothetical protein V3U68_04355 [Bacteroidota bacterium]